MNARQVVVLAVAAALGVWVAIAAAQGGAGGGGSGTGPCVSYSTSGSTTGVGCPRGFGVGGSGGGTGPRHKHHGGPGEHGQPGGKREVGNPGSKRRRGHHQHLTFTFVVRLGHGAHKLSVSGYSARILPPRHAPASCQARVLRINITGKKSQLARVRVRPPLGGWCAGRYRVTVGLKH